MGQKEFLELINKHNGIIQKIIFLYVENRQDQEDLNQEIVLQAWKSIRHFRGDAKFSTWLYRVALNTVLTFKRRVNKKQMESLDRIEIEQGINHESDQSSLLYRAIRRLSDVDKAIITLHLEDFTNQEISDATGLTKNNVAVKLHRIKEALLRELKAHRNG